VKHSPGVHYALAAAREERLITRRERRKDSFEVTSVMPRTTSQAVIIRAVHALIKAGHLQVQAHPFHMVDSLLGLHRVLLTPSGEDVADDVDRQCPPRGCC